MKSSPSVLKRTISVFNLILAICGAICLVGFIGCTIYQVLARNLLPKAPIWTEEAARFLFIYMVSFGVGLAVHTGDYVGVELLVDLLPEKGLRILKVITMFALAAFCFWYFFASVLDFGLQISFHGNEATNAVHLHQHDDPFPGARHFIYSGRVRADIHACGNGNGTSS